MSQNDLLLWLSAKKSGTWRRYRAAVDELQIFKELSNSDEDLGEDALDNTSLPIYHRLRLNLERLGHVEFFRKDFKSGWRIVPPILACSSNKENAIGILCGARTDNILGKLLGATNLRVSVTQQIECPDRIKIIADEPLLGHLEQLANSTGLYFQANATQMLLASMPPVDDWQYRMLAELPFGEDWDVHRFSAETFKWSSATAEEARDASLGLYRFKIAHQLQYYIRFHGSTYKIPVQMGKYLMLIKKRKRVVLYNTENQTFSVPVSCRPPLLVDRALTLCSGLIPCIDNGRLTYANVSSSIAMTAVNLLRQ